MSSIVDILAKKLPGDVTINP